jgi:pantoate kinase
VARDILSDLDVTKALVSLFRSSWTFATRTNLSTPRIDEAVSAVQAAGGVATMAMIGETVVAVGKEGVLDQSTHITNSGAALR